MNGEFRRNATAYDGGYLSLVTAPVAAIISTADAKAHCRVESSDDDAVIDGFVASVSDYLDAENGILGRALITQTWRLVLNSPPRTDIIRLPFPPVQSVSSVGYFDADGNEQTFGASSYRFISGGDEPFVELVSNASWPDVQDRSGAFWVEYVAGYGDSASDLPENMVTAAKVLLGHYYENREAVSEGSFSPVPYLFDMMINPFRVSRF